MTPKSTTGQNFYPRSPCGERLELLTERLCNSVISIHALLAESDESRQPCARPTTNFYPRSPCGERRCEIASIERCNLISIHALLAESDNITTITICTAWIFLSTLSLRRATSSSINSSYITAYFYPRSPCGERLMYRWQNQRQNQFLSTLSLRRATQYQNCE